MSVNKYRAEKTLNLNGTDYTVRMGLDTCMRIESQLGCSILKVGNMLASADISLQNVITILHYALRGGGNDIQEKDVKKIVSDIGLLESIKACGEVITLALNVDTGDEEEDEKKP